MTQTFMPLYNCMVCNRVCSSFYGWHEKSHLGTPMGTCSRKCNEKLVNQNQQYLVLPGR